MIEWKYTNGLCLAAYSSDSEATLVVSGAPIGTCPQVADSRTGSLPMSSRYAFQESPAVSSWSGTVFTIGGAEPLHPLSATARKVMPESRTATSNLGCCRRRRALRRKAQRPRKQDRASCGEHCRREKRRAREIHAGRAGGRVAEHLGHERRSHNGAQTVETGDRALQFSLRVGGDLLRGERVHRRIGEREQKGGERDYVHHPALGHEGISDVGEQASRDAGGGRASLAADPRDEHPRQQALCNGHDQADEGERIN